MRTKQPKEKYNQLPRPTFHWMKANYLELDPMEAAPKAAYTPQERHEGDVSVTFSDSRVVPELGDFQGSNAEALKKALTESGSNCAISVEAGKKGAVWLTYTVSEALAQLQGQLSITAGVDSELTVYVLFEGGTAEGAVNFLSYVNAADRAKVKISKVQLNGTAIRHIEHRYAVVGKESTVDFVNAELGSQKAIVYYKTDMMDDEGTFNSQAMYMGNADQVVDFSYWVPMKGVKTTANINTTGALLDTSKKFFRGTIDFLRGSKKAVGSEADTCILLSPKVHSISVPLLLCKEDDVVGNHASSAGQIDKDKLFYLMSRGFSEAGAQLIIVESNIRPVIDAIGDKDLENKALQAVREKMQSCRQKGDCNVKCTQRFPHLD